MSARALLPTLLFITLLGCDDPAPTPDPQPDQGADANERLDLSADAALDAQPDAWPDSDAATHCPGEICGTIHYQGQWQGGPVPIYIRAYREEQSASPNPSAAIGPPDFHTSVQGPGHYQLALGDYTGPVYLSAFMDTDDSGSPGGPNGRLDLANGVRADPMGAHGGYTFEDDPATRPTRLVLGPEGLTGIDILLTDPGVITGTLHRGAAPTEGVLMVGAFEPQPGGLSLHHHHYETFEDGMRYLVALPAKADWRLRAKVGAAVGYYPHNPPPRPPANTEPVTVEANALTEGLDITLR